MKITDLLEKNRILLHTQAKDKEDILRQMAALQKSSGVVAEEAVYYQAILDREALGSTAVGGGVAVPHAKSDTVLRPALAAMTLEKAVPFDAADGSEVDVIFMIAAPKDGEVHLEILSKLMVLLMDSHFVEELRQAKNAEELLAVIDRYEAKKDEGGKQEAKSGFFLCAVTACPTGIAHTYMAAEALEKKAQEMGGRIRVETQGSGGTKHQLTREEIASCDGVIVAADKEVDLERFHGKALLRVPVSDGIHRPQELIRAVTEGQAPVYTAQEASGETYTQTKETVGRKIYKQLMNGVSHMLPFVIGGGILIALAFLVDDPSIDYANFGMNTPLAAWFKQIGNAAFGFMLPILAGYIAMAIADRPALMVGFAGGALALSGATFASPGGSDVSAGFLGALIAGFAAGYLILGVRKVSDYLPQALEGIKPVLIYPVAGLLLIGLVMCLINPFIATLNEALYRGLETMGNGSKVALGVVLAGMMAIDMGGPFNKAAYVFGTSTLATMTTGSDVMAAVMIGGMVPPIAIALATTVFPSKFTAEERKSGVVNYIMGLCFITEGAIPFAAADPLRVLPSCMIGSAVAGGLSMFFGCTLPAPHGGIFVFAVIGNWLGYLVALAIGSLIGMACLGFLKNRQKA